MNRFRRGLTQYCSFSCLCNISEGSPHLPLHLHTYCRTVLMNKNSLFTQIYYICPNLLSIKSRILKTTTN